MPHWIRRLFQKTRAETELDNEVRFHLDRQIADYVAAGISAEEARRRAKLEFGGLERVKEEVRDVRWETHVDNLFRDFRAVAVEQLGSNGILGNEVRHWCTERKCGIT